MKAGSINSRAGMRALEQSKFYQLAVHMRAGRWRDSLSLAAKFPRLGIHGPAIRRAHEAHWRPGFYAQLGMDPNNLICTGIKALKERYGKYV